MIQTKIKSVEEIANKHVYRLQDAIKHLANTFPISESSVQNFSEQEILYLEMLTSRFAKLQDHLGANVIDLFFQANQENSDSMTMIDKLNRLEKFGILEDAHLWQDMRDARNIIAHEYPDKPKLIADTLNLIYGYCPQLIAIKDRLFAHMPQI